MSCAYVLCGLPGSCSAGVANAPTAVVRDAKAAAGRFPLIVFIHAAAADESILAEYLASHGFVVAGAPSQGSFERAYRLSLADLETLTRNAESVIATGRSVWPQAPDSFGAIGMSNGANAAVKLALRNDSLAAVVSLDGTIGEKAAARAIPADTYFDLQRLRVPILHFYTDVNPYLDLDTLRSWSRSERTLILMHDLRHEDFLANGLLQKTAPALKGATDISASYEWLCERTLAFFDEKLHGAPRDQRGAPFQSNAPDEGLFPR